VKIDILTLFPEMFSPFDASIIKRARDKKLLEINTYNIRDFSNDKHKKVDDYPYGGGCGMVMSAEPVYNAVEYIFKNSETKPKVLLMTPEGKIFNQDMARQLSKEKHLLFICGHYEGIDERIKPLVDMEISIGDFVLTGGELASMVIIDAVSRMVPGVLSSQLSYEDESFYDGLLEYPQYTRPEVFRDMRVPQVLLSGHHEKVRKWRRYQSLKKTKEKRPELIDYSKLTEEDKKFLLMIESGDETI